MILLAASPPADPSAGYDGFIGWVLTLMETIGELGVGIERFSEADADPRPYVSNGDTSGNFNEKGSGDASKQGEGVRQKKQSSEDVEAVESIPVVIIKNFESKGGGSRKEELLNVLAQWAANLAENQVSSFRPLIMIQRR